MDSPSLSGAPQGHAQPSSFSVNPTQASRAQVSAHLLSRNGWGDTPHSTPPTRRLMHDFVTPANAMPPTHPHEFITPGHGPHGGTTHHTRSSTPSNSSGSANSSFSISLEEDSSPFNASYVPHPPQHAFNSPERFISNDLFHLVVEDYALNMASSMRLGSFRELIAKVPTMSKEIAVPMFFILAAVLNSQQLTEQLRVQVPPMEKFLQMFDKLENRLSLIPFRLSEFHMDNIRGLANGIIFEASNYSFNDLPERLYAACEARASNLHLGEAFQTPANAKILNQECSKIASSVKNGFREYILKSVDASSKGKPSSLAMCTYKASEKYRGKGVVIEPRDAIKLAMLRRFALENSELSGSESEVTPPAASKRKTGSDTATAVLPPSTNAASSEPMVPHGIRIFENGMMWNDQQEMVSQPARAPNSNFWQLWDWHYKRLQVALGPKDSQAWVKYVTEIVELDRQMFPLEKGAVGVDQIDAKLAPTGPSTGPGVTAPLAPPVSYADVSI